MTKLPTEHQWCCLERLNDTKFLGVHITEDLSCNDDAILLAKKAQQCLYFQCKLKRELPPPIMYSHSVLTGCITVWYGGCTASCRKTLQHIVNTASKVNGAPLPSLANIFQTRFIRRAISIAGGLSHPLHPVFSLLPSGKQYTRLH